VYTADNCGIVFLSGGIRSHLNIGDAITLGSTIITSFGILKIEEYSKSEEPIMLGIMQIFFACAFSGSIWALSGFDRPVINMDSARIIFLTGVVGTGIAFVIQVFGQKMTSPINTALAFINISIFGVIGSALIPNAHGMTEHMTGGKIIGSLIIATGMVIYVISIHYSEKSEKSKYIAKTYKAS
jgi:drug/metabolite transporter (DMT)-like permease